MPSRGSGSIRPFGDGYRASIYVAGQRRRRVFPSESAAERWLVAQRRERRRAKPRPRGDREDVTYDELIPELLAWYGGGSKRVYTPRALDGYRSELKRVAERWGPRRVAATTQGEIDRWVAELREAGLATSTVRHVLDRLSALHRVAVRLGYLASLPCEVERPRLVELSPVEPLTDDEADRLVDAAARDWDRRPLAVVLLCLDAGLRRGEVPLLRGEDVDLDAGRIRLRVRGESKDRPKGARPRDVPIFTARLRACFEKLPRDRGRSLLEIRSPSGVASCCCRAWTAAGLPGLPALHRLRHAWATRLGAAGFPLAEIQRWAGHSTITTTMRYVHPSGQVAAEARARFDRWATDGPQKARGPSRLKKA